MQQKKEGLKELRTSIFTRGLALFQASLKANRSKRVEAVVRELGQLKGTAMKVGQALSMYGEHLLPKEVNEVLKTLQQASTPLAWEPIERVLREDLGHDCLDRLEVEREAVAAASIGQVHRARCKSSGTALALKVQYPDIERAIETDLKLLKFMLTMTDLIPRGPRFEQVFQEIREMFYQEIDYTLEREFCDYFHRQLADDKRYIIPKIHPDYCSRRILAASLVDGHRADSVAVQSLSQERRNLLGRAFLELYLRELLEFKLMQTDPHLGNYMIDIHPGDGVDRLVLFDFGATRAVPNDFLEKYRLLIEGGITKDARMIEKGGRLMGLLLPDDSLDLVQDYVELSCLICEPFDGIYDWGASDLPKRVAAKAVRITTSYKLRSPPRELVFLDRKLGGVFIFLSVLKCKMDSRAMLMDWLKRGAQEGPSTTLVPK